MGPARDLPVRGAGYEPPTGAAVGELNDLTRQTDDIDSLDDLEYDICIAKPSKIKCLVDLTALFRLSSRLRLRLILLSRRRSSKSRSLRYAFRRKENKVRISEI